jgi:hypothetical protein
VKKEFVIDVLIVFAVVGVIVIAWLATLDECQLESDVQCKATAHD